MTAAQQYHVPQTYFFSPMLIFLLVGFRPFATTNNHMVARLEDLVNAQHHSRRQPCYSRKFATERAGALAMSSEDIYGFPSSSIDYYTSSTTGDDTYEYSSSTDDYASSTTGDDTYEYSWFLDDFLYDDDYSTIYLYDDSSSVFDDDSSSVFDDDSSSVFDDDYSWSYYDDSFGE